ncbi:MAG: VapC toxin protein [uncultured Gemmatimonadetes bacterium]|uniref:Ribonuclease VapC n=1 Tax=uncultured Gemmatimonadota bacterium TaxID=203437 RepID=A0A6J4M0S4_9BACT|nr:MAG: VapC toxin protein [uncultured Gemmatimonadota bacterium]
MRYLLDTDTCIWLLRKREPVVSRVIAESPEDLAIASMTLAELYFGAMNGNNPDREEQKIERLIFRISEVIAFDQGAARIHAELRYALRANKISERDLVIASVGVANSLILVTSNQREFRRVPGLQLEDWMVSQ